MRAILLHGMGRTPLAMLPLALRLRAAHIETTLFGYSPSYEKWSDCLTRLRKFILSRSMNQPYSLIGHSLGTALIRAVLPSLPQPPHSCFFLAPPGQACRAARHLAPNALFRMMAGEMGQLLATPSFMDNLPVPLVPTLIFSGTGGPRRKWFPLGFAPNDGILTVEETRIAELPIVEIPSLHTFIMNSPIVTRSIIAAITERSAAPEHATKLDMG